MLLSEGFFYSFKKDSLTCRGGGTPYNGLYGEAPPERPVSFSGLIYMKG